jgi:hypothetical protein
MQGSRGVILYFAAKDVCCYRVRAWYAWSTKDVWQTAAARLTEAETRKKCEYKGESPKAAACLQRSVASSRS